MPHADELTERDYQRLSEWVQAECGVQLQSTKQTMIKARLGRRVRALGLSSLAEYFEYLRTEQGRTIEIQNLIDAVTTHKTDFFREPAHFEYLTARIVPELSRRLGAGVNRPLAVWSAASSTGEEPYTLAMVLSDYAARVAPTAFRYKIEATDISRPVLETAVMAVYPESAILPVPAAMRRRYLLRSRDPQKPRVRIVPELRAAVKFRQLNLMESDYGFTERLDVVFCRNVMIYFDRKTQEEILGRILKNLVPGGYLVMGHSESLTGLELAVEQVSPTVYRSQHA